MRFEASGFVGFDDAGFGGFIEGLIDPAEHGFRVISLAGDREFIKLLDRVLVGINPLQIPDSSGFTLA